MFEDGVALPIEPSSAALERRLQLMKEEVDGLQIAMAVQSRPWYKSASAIISIVALAFSFGTTYLSHARVTAQDLQSTRQELRSLLQRLAALPKENIDIQREYQDDPASWSVIGSMINTENSLLASHAAQIARHLPENAISAAEYQAVAFALQSSYDLEGAAEFIDRSVATARDFNTEIGALRTKANIHFLRGAAENGRDVYRQALDIFSKYPGYDSYTVASTMIWTELSWASSEANIGQLDLANQHVQVAESIVDRLPASPGTERLRAQIWQAKSLYFAGASPASPSTPPPPFLSLP